MRGLTVGELIHFVIDAGLVFWLILLLWSPDRKDTFYDRFHGFPQANLR